ncbi:TetR family transcriptional regulator [Novosphingobium sp. MMS21-SN21R]|uniref:TetR family transcriptional regulator n=1 Tax=Novosphingobium sp. MMS21-SN21R TaxID=2969298 RepID=UPI0028878266|nr:TetR family transcriptional regulator [Novosphingobium sp. MMS21-SN21R]MDT0508550.1 TetR family transcriptional regulator [Novosphingobium sp. MMS21-SN21R]
MEKKPTLDTAAIRAAGLAILQAEGFETLSLRKIADVFGVQTPALYWYVKNRAELYGLMAEALLREVLAEVDFTLQGREWLVELGRALRRSHLHRRDSARLIAYVAPTEAMENELAERIDAHLVAGGMTAAEARLAQSTINSFTLGWSLFEGNRRLDTLMVGGADPELAFDAALNAVAQGLSNISAVMPEARQGPTIKVETHPPDHRPTP